VIKSSREGRPRVHDLRHDPRLYALRPPYRSYRSHYFYVRIAMGASRCMIWPACGSESICERWHRCAGVAQRASSSCRRVHLIQAVALVLIDAILYPYSMDLKCCTAYVITNRNRQQSETISMRISRARTGSPSPDESYRSLVKVTSAYLSSFALASPNLSLRLHLCHTRPVFPVRFALLATKLSPDAVSGSTVGPGWRAALRVHRAIKSVNRRSCKPCQTPS